MFINFYAFGKAIAQNINDMHVSKLVPILVETKKSFVEGLTSTKLNSNDVWYEGCVSEMKTKLVNQSIK